MTRGVNTGWFIACSWNGMFRTLLSLVFVILLIGMMPILGQTAKDDLKGAKEDVKEAGKSTGRAAKKTGKAVPDAVIIAKRIDMAPDAMAEMVSPIEQVPSTEPGVYRFKTNLSMEGRWQLSLGARVQGETGTVQSKLVLKAVP